MTVEYLNFYLFIYPGKFPTLCTFVLIISIHPCFPPVPLTILPHQFFHFENIYSMNLNKKIIPKEFSSSAFISLDFSPIYL